MEPEYLSTEQLQYELRARNIIVAQDASRRDLSLLLRNALSDEHDGTKIFLPSPIEDPVVVEDEIFDLFKIVNDLNAMISQPGRNVPELNSLMIHARGRLKRLIIPSQLKQEGDKLSSELDYIQNKILMIRQNATRKSKPSSEKGKNDQPRTDAEPQMAEPKVLEFFPTEDETTDRESTGAIPKIRKRPAPQISGKRPVFDVNPIPIELKDGSQHNLELNLEMGSLIDALREAMLQKKDKPPSISGVSPLVTHEPKSGNISQKRSKSVGFVHDEVSSSKKKNSTRQSSVEFWDFSSSDNDTDDQRRSRRSRHHERGHRNDVTSDTDSSSEPRARRNHRRSNSHRSSPIRQWDLRFSGNPEKDEYSFKQFCKVVERLARSRGMTRTDLFESGIQLFEGKARKWYLSNMHKFNSWHELKKRYKKDKLRDKDDEHMLDEAYDRKQYEHEMCADFVEAIQNIFESMDDPPEERKQVHIAQKNMLSEHRVQLVSSGRKFRTLDQLLEHCRDLDIVRRDVERERARNRPSFRRSNYYSSAQTSNPHVGYQANQNRGVERDQPRSNANGSSFQGRGQNSSENQGRNLRWKCWNCDSESHGFRSCPQPMGRFCANCGFKNVTTDQCPRCKPNFRRGPEGFRRQ